VVNKDTGGALALRGLVFAPDAVAVTSGYAVALQGPPEGTRIPSLAVPLVLLVSSTSALNTDVALEVATSSGFGGSVVYSNTLTNRGDGTHSVTVSGLVNLTKYWWRARAAETGTTAWTAWTPARTFIPDLNAGKAFGFVVENVGFSPAVSSTGLWAVAENVGLALLPASAGVWSSVFNAGLPPLVSGSVPFYVFEGDVSTNPPGPHVWFLRPSAGRSGDGIAIYCFGVGDLVGTYSGSVQLYYGAVLGWVTVPVTSWQTFPASANAYTAARKLDTATAFIDMQHSKIEIVVPDGALPPGYPVRIRTVTP
jgi:hypothetical protein